MKICITGGSGFIGSKLSELLSQSGHQVLVLDVVPPREKKEGIDFIQADLMHAQVPKEILEYDAIVHLAGVNIFGRWTSQYKKLIVDSRIKSAHAIISFIKEHGGRPKVFVSASAIGYYGEGGENTLDESSPVGTDFLAHVCKEWEAVAQTAEQAGMRWVSIRTAIVLGPHGGMLSKLLPLFKLGLGGILGSGKQWFSWIHLNDLLNIYTTALFDDRLHGPINAVAPEPVRNKDFTKTLGKVLHRPAILWVPGFALSILLGEVSKAILISQKVQPKKLQSINYIFKNPTLYDALQDSI